MPRGKDPIHDCYIEAKGADGKDRATCKYCGKSYASNTNRQKKHILQECNQVSAVLRSRYAVLDAPSFTASCTSTVSDHAEANFIADNPTGMCNLCFHW